MYQRKVRGHVYCSETTYVDGFHSTISNGRCKPRKECEKICGTLKKRNKNRFHRRVLRRIKSSILSQICKK